MLNRDVVLTPFHNMTLVCPATSPAHVARLHSAFNYALDALTG